jgi:hypothetical protein
MNEHECTQMVRSRWPTNTEQREMNAVGWKESEAHRFGPRGHVRAVKLVRQVPDRRTPETSSCQLVFNSG